MINKPIDVVFKDEKIGNSFLGLHPLCVMLLGEMCAWAWNHSLPFIITETLTTEEEDKLLKRVSRTHREGRAFDISDRNWRAYNITEFVSFFNHKYKEIAAVTTSGAPALVVHHDAGTGTHFHIQINSQYAINEKQRMLP